MPVLTFDLDNNHIVIEDTDLSFKKLEILERVMILLLEEYPIDVVTKIAKEAFSEHRSGT